MDDRMLRYLTAQEVGDAVKAHRLEKGITQEDLADLSGVSQECVEALEAGNPRVQLGEALLVFEAIGIQIATTDPSAAPRSPHTALLRVRKMAPAQRRVQVAAARLRTTLDERLERSTPPDVTALAQKAL
jgi:transcriptional regulator with XRE-family HTH domain